MPSGRPRRLFLIDGFALIYRAFFALGEQQLVSSKGENTAIAYVTQDFIRRLLDRHQPEAVAWVEDAGRSFRHEIFPDYKATRERLDPGQQADFDTGVSRAHQILDGFRIPVVASDGFEADDVIGTLATKAAAQGVEVVIVSGDKDFMQLVKPGITVLNPWHGRPGRTSEKWYDTAAATTRMGVPPERVVDYLALLGDASDNIPGVRGIGEKTAHALISTWGPIENMLEHLDEVEPARARTALREHGAEGKLSKQLVTIRTDLAVEPDFEKLAAREPDWGALRDVFVELEFRVPAQEAAARASRKSPPIGETGSRAASPVYKTLSDATSVDRLVDRARAIGSISVDVHAVTTHEPSGAQNPLRTRLVGLAVALRPGEAYYLPFAHRGQQLPAENHTLALGDVPQPDVGLEQPNLPPLSDPPMRALKELLEDAAIAKFGHDLKRQVLILRAAGVTLRGIEFDVMLASYLLDPGRRSHDLADLAIEFLQRSVPGEDDVLGRGRDRRSFDMLAADEACDFAAMRADTCGALRPVLAERLSAVGADALLASMELPLLSVLADMEWEGIRVDLPWFHSLRERFAQERKRVEAAVFEAAGEEFNINSNRQLANILFDRLNLPVRKKTTTGPSTDATVLQQLADEGHALPALILEYREIAKLESTYLATLPELVNPATGRIHTTYHQAVAATGRLASSDPNLQNIPVRSELGRDIRRGFIPRPGWTLMTADYSQIELRLLAHLSGDRAFVEAFEAGGDIHRQTAAIIFGVSPEDVTPEMRAQAKTINFATIYGQGAHALSQQLKVEHAVARDFINTYFERFAGVRAFLDATVEQARARGYVETILGRRRYIPELKDRNFNIRSFGERTAQNSPIQGSAADLIKVAMIAIARSIQDAKLEARMLLQVHDELVFEAPPHEVETLRRLVTTAMTTAVPLRVPLVVDIGTGANWVEAKA
jgi:DNA polymerase-1